MSNSLVFSAIGLAVVLLLSATVTLALRLVSRAGLAEKLERANRSHFSDRLRTSRGDLAICAATLRTGCSLALVLVVHRMVEVSGELSLSVTYLTSFLLAFGLVVLLGVAIPTAWAKYSGESILVVSLPFLLAMLRVCAPLVFVLKLLDSLVRRLSGIAPVNENDEAERQERELLHAVSESEQAGAVDEEEKEMIESVMDLRDSDVEEIMTPRTEIEALECRTTLPEIKKFIADIGHSRIPLYEETIDHIVGILYAKDLLSVENADAFNARKVMRAAQFIPETKNLRDLLHDFRTQKVHMAIVLDEYGGTAGLVTIEDILEELVGEIVDEFDADEPEPVTRIDADTAEIDARTRIEEINEELDVALPEEEDFETIGGFVFSTLGRIPRVGETCTHENIDIRVIAAEPRRINRVRLHINRNDSNEDG